MAQPLNNDISLRIVDDWSQPLQVGQGTSVDPMTAPMVGAVAPVQPAPVASPEQFIPVAAQVKPTIVSSWDDYSAASEIPVPAKRTDEIGSITQGQREPQAKPLVDTSWMNDTAVGAAAGGISGIGMGVAVDIGLTVGSKIARAFPTTGVVGPLVLGLAGAIGGGVIAEKFNHMLGLVPKTWEGEAAKAAVTSLASMGVPLTRSKGYVEGKYVDFANTAFGKRMAKSFDAVMADTKKLPSYVMQQVGLAAWAATANGLTHDMSNPTARLFWELGINAGGVAVVGALHAAGSELNNVYRSMVGLDVTGVPAGAAERMARASAKHHGVDFDAMSPFERSNALTKGGRDFSKLAGALQDLFRHAGEDPESAARFIRASQELGIIPLSSSGFRAVAELRKILLSYGFPQIEDRLANEVATALNDVRSISKGMSALGGQEALAAEQIADKAQATALVGLILSRTDEALQKATLAVSRGSDVPIEQIGRELNTVINESYDAVMAVNKVLWEALPGETKIETDNLLQTITKLEKQLSPVNSQSADLPEDLKNFARFLAEQKEFKRLQEKAQNITAPEPTEPNFKVSSSGDVTKVEMAGPSFTKKEMERMTELRLSIKEWEIKDYLPLISGLRNNARKAYAGVPPDVNQGRIYNDLADAAQEDLHIAADAAGGAGSEQFRQAAAWSKAVAKVYRDLSMGTVLERSEGGGRLVRPELFVEFITARSAQSTELVLQDFMVAANMIESHNLGHLPLLHADPSIVEGFMRREERMIGLQDKIIQYIASEAALYDAQTMGRTKYNAVVGDKILTEHAVLLDRFPAVRGMLEKMQVSEKYRLDLADAATSYSKEITFADISEFKRVMGSPGAVPSEDYAILSELAGRFPPALRNEAMVKLAFNGNPRQIATNLLDTSVDMGKGLDALSGWIKGRAGVDTLEKTGQLKDGITTAVFANIIEKSTTDGILDIRKFVHGLLGERLPGSVEPSVLNSLRDHGFITPERYTEISETLGRGVQILDSEVKMKDPSVLTLAEDSASVLAPGFLRMLGSNLVRRIPFIGKTLVAQSIGAKFAGTTVWDTLRSNMDVSTNFELAAQVTLNDPKLFAELFTHTPETTVRVNQSLAGFFTIHGMARMVTQDRAGPVDLSSGMGQE